VVELLERKYPRFPGLNLSWEVREGIAKHSTSYDHPDAGPGFNARSASLEAQVANLADEVTYYSHDLDDGLTAGLLDEKVLTKHVKVWAEAARRVKKEYSELPEESRRYYIIRVIIDEQVKDVVTTSEALIDNAGVQSADDVRRFPQPLICYSAKRRGLNAELRKYLYKNLYFNPEVHEPNYRAGRMLDELFKHCIQHPQEIGEHARQRVKKEGLHRAVCDYLAGMTDRYAILEHQRLFGLKI
jgi:dGTPase